MIPYPAYKSTNLPWLPKIPEHWEAIKIRELFVERNQKVSDKDFAPLSVSKGGIVPQIATVAKTDNGENRKLVREGDFVINSRSDRKGSSGISSYDGSVSLINLVLRPRIACNRRYLHYLLKSIPFVEEYYRNGRGIVADLWTTRYSEMKTISIPFPSSDEQEQIVRYLDAMTAKINKLIRAKKKQIALLQEQRQAIINQAVIRGLDPNAEMKDSGIDWLGKIPKHWILNKVGHFYQSILGKMLANTPSSPHDSFEKYLCAKDVHFDGVDLTDLKKMWFSPEEKMKYRVKPGDLLVVEGGAGAGGAAVFNGFSENLYVQNSIHIVRPKGNNTTVQFLYYWIYALVGRKYIDFSCNKATIPHFTGDKLFEMPFVLAPLAEQKEIVNYLDIVCRKYDTIIDKLNNEINLSTEYKNSLISSVVTGQTDVRNIPVEDIIPDALIAEDDSTSEIEEEPTTSEESEE